MNVPSLAREVARRLVGEALAGVREVPRVLLRRQLAVPPGAEQRAVEKDAAADVRVDQALAPARRVLARALRLGAEPLLEEAELAAAERERPRRHDDRDRERGEDALPGGAIRRASASADHGTRPRGRGRAGSRATRRAIAEAAGDDRDERRSRARRRARGRRARPTTSAIVASAARSCSPRNEPWRPPAPLTNPTRPRRPPRPRRRDDQLGERGEPLACRRGTRRRPGSARRTRRASRPTVNASAPFGDRGRDDQKRERRGRREQPG